MRESGADAPVGMRLTLCSRKPTRASAQCFRLSLIEPADWARRQIKQRFRHEIPRPEGPSLSDSRGREAADQPQIKSAGPEGPTLRKSKTFRKSKAAAPPSTRPVRPR
jgi:hypothetical protein